MVIGAKPPKRPFASDNSAGAHPAVMEGIAAANQGHTLAYGSDPWTDRLVEEFSRLFDTDVATYPTFNGTGANVLALGTVLGPGEAVVSTPWSHITVDETGAPERILGTKIIEVPSSDGKIAVDALASLDHLRGVQHHSQPGVLSITQVTELGTVYTPDEITALVDASHERGMRVHLDGARLANAAAAVGGIESLRAMTVGAGVDVITFGGTKNGGLGAEAVVVLDPDLAAPVPYLRKQYNQLASKMRFLSAQLLVLLRDDLWLDLASHANAMGARLYEATRKIPGVDHPWTPEANSVFPVLPLDVVSPLQEWSFFWPWDPEKGQVRWMTAWDTTEEDVELFSLGVAEIMGS
ncbi:MAG: threonine aldolase [Acidimicrobiia bacterium]|nr:threonine aldolase [Acidimicrobiia bacterium]